MFKSLSRAQKVAVSVLAQRSSLYTPVVQYSIFSLFKQKKNENLPQGLQKPKDQGLEEVETEEQKAEKQRLEDVFIDKKQYYEKIKKERDEYEAEREKAKREFEFEEQRDRRLMLLRLIMHALHKKILILYSRNPSNILKNCTILFLIFV